MLEGEDASLHPRPKFPSVSARKKRRFTALAHGQHSHTGGVILLMTELLRVGSWQAGTGD